MRKKLPLSVHLRERGIADGKIQLYLDITRNGKRWKEATHQILLPGSSRLIKKKNEEARLVAETMRREREQALLDEINGIQRTGTGYLDSFFKFYEDCMREYEGSRTIQMWESALSHLHIFEKRDDLVFADIDEDWVKAWKHYLEYDAVVLRGTHKKLARNTASVLFQKVVCCFNKARQKKLITFSPFDGVKGIKREDSHRQYLTKEELDRLAATPFQNADVKNSFLFSCLTGLRFTDVITLTWSEIIEEKDRMYVATMMDKPDRMIYIPLNASARKLIGERGIATDLLFPSVKHNRSVNRAISRWVARAGIQKHITFHNARHTFATQLLSNDVDIYTTQKLLGHTNISTTEIYAKLVDEKKVRAIDALDSLIDL